VNAGFPENYFSTMSYIVVINITYNTVQNIQNAT